jgi:D-alanine-D-alanine ligase-like ATP-grasp enzyme
MNDNITIIRRERNQRSGARMSAQAFETAYVLASRDLGHQIVQHLAVHDLVLTEIFLVPTDALEWFMNECNENPGAIRWSRGIQ